MNTELTADVRFIIERIMSRGGSAHVVGGAVRDMLLGRDVGDYDLTTSLTPEEVKAAFPEYKILDTGIKHGTVTLVIDGVPYEITTYRTDGDYRDSRHPDSVSFTASLEEDLARRDFTVNAMCIDPVRGLTDIFGGREDLSRGLIRAVGDPHRRFTEDALRILRALRFASVLDFEIESDTARAVHELCHTLVNISAERIYTEWRKLLCGKGAYRILSEYADVLRVIIPEIGELRLPRAEKFSSADMMTRFISLFFGASDAPARFDAACHALRTDNSTRTLGKDALSALSTASLDTVAGMRHAMAKYGEDAVCLAVRAAELLELVPDGAGALFDTALALPHKISDLAVRGNDLGAMGMRGEKIGNALSLLLRALIDGDVADEREAQLHYAREHFKGEK